MDTAKIQARRARLEKVRERVFQRFIRRRDRIGRVFSSFHELATPLELEIDHNIFLEIQYLDGLLTSVKMSLWKQLKKEASFYGISFSKWRRMSVADRDRFKVASLMSSQQNLPV